MTNGKWQSARATQFFITFKWLEIIFVINRVYQIMSNQPFEHNNSLCLKKVSFLRAKRAKMFELSLQKFKYF